jgi:hypothetical protein
LYYLEKYYSNWAENSNPTLTQPGSICKEETGLHIGLLYLDYINLAHGSGGYSGGHFRRAMELEAQTLKRDFLRDTIAPMRKKQTPQSGGSIEQGA